LALANYVQANDCGIIVAEISPQAILQAIDQLLANYPTFQQNALAVGSRDFGQEQFIAATLALYNTVSGVEFLSNTAVFP
jgi:glycosyltransferase involved in cell wall biosynthesis